MPARDSLWMQMQMADDLAEGSFLAAMLDGFDRSQRGIVEPRNDPFNAVPQPFGLFAPPSQGGIEYRPGALRDYLKAALDVALPFYVDSRMMPVITGAAEMMPDEVLHPHDLPHTHGFCLIPGGLTEIDIRGQLMVHNVVLWVQRAGGVDLWFLSNKYEERDSVNLRQRTIYGDVAYADLPLLMPAHYIRLTYGETLPETIGAKKVLPPELTDKITMVPGPDGTYTWTWPEGVDLQEWVTEAMTPMPDELSRWLLTMWRLMQQTLTDVRTEGVDRQLRRAATKRKMRTDAVTVVTLRKRRTVVVEGEPQHVEWSHRHWRKGHWAPRWVGPRNGEPDQRYQRQVYIHPTLVLAYRTDLPILERDRVYNLRR